MQVSKQLCETLPSSDQFEWAIIIPYNILYHPIQKHFFGLCFLKNVKGGNIKNKKVMKIKKMLCAYSSSRFTNTHPSVIFRKIKHLTIAQKHFFKHNYYHSAEDANNFSLSLVWKCSYPELLDNLSYFDYCTFLYLIN